MPAADPHAAAEATLRALALAYPEAAEASPWGRRAIKVRAKIFLLLDRADGVLAVTTKLPDSNRYALAQRYAAPTGYGLGKSGWVTCLFHPGEAIPTDLLEEWVDESYRAVAPKALVLALNARLGGAELLALAKPQAAKKPRAKKKPKRKKT